MNRYVLTLVRPTSAKELPHATGAPRQVTSGKGKWHVHGGAWSPDKPVDRVHKGLRSREPQRHRQLPLKAVAKGERLLPQTNPQIAGTLFGPYKIAFALGPWCPNGFHRARHDARTRASRITPVLSRSV